MKKVLLPIDISERSLKTINRFKEGHTPEEAEATLLTVMEGSSHFKFNDEYERYRQKLLKELEDMTAQLEGYKVSTVVLQGNPGSCIVDYVKNNKFDLLIMTRSKRGVIGKLGFVASYIVRQAPNMNLLILKED